MDALIQKRTSTTVLAAEANLTITVNEPGLYKLDAMLLMAAQNANVVAGFNLDFNGGTASLDASGCMYYNGINMVSTFERITASLPQASATPPTKQVLMDLVVWNK